MQNEIIESFREESFPCSNKRRIIITNIGQDHILFEQSFFKQFPPQK